MDEARKNYIITVGIDEYKYPEKGLGSLGSSCLRDCQQLINILTRDYESFSIIDKVYTESNSIGRSDEQVLYGKSATKSKIQSLFTNLSYHPDFILDPEEGKPSQTHNLIIFFSGHGAAVREQFYWVPYDYDGPSPRLDINKLYSVSDELMAKLRNIRYHHLIIIADSCHSGATFTNANIFNQAAPIVNPDSTPEKEMSSWALCSSASNQSSYADGSNSMMSGSLLNLLTENTLENMAIEDLFAKISTRVTQSTAGNTDAPSIPQRVFYNRIGIGPGRTNTGMFYLHANARKLERAQTGRIANALVKVIPYNLNYSREKEELEKLREPSGNTCVIISGDKESAPAIVSKIMHKDRFLRYLKDWPWLDPNDLKTRSGETTDIVLELFQRAGIREELKTDTQLVKILHQRLEDGHFVLKLQFKQPLLRRVELLQELQRMAADVRSRSAQYFLIILVVDNENTPYRPVFTDVDRLTYLHMDEKRLIKKKDFRDWYGKQYDALEDEKLQAYFDACIINNMSGIIGNEDRPPGVVIEKICDLAGCSYVAGEILNLYTI